MRCPVIACRTLTDLGPHVAECVRIVAGYVKRVRGAAAARFVTVVRMSRLVDELRADFAVNRWALDRVTVFVLRLNQAARRSRLRAVTVTIARLLDVLWVQLLMGAHLPARASIGAGLRLPHGGRGVHLHPNASLGRNVTIYHRVTLGVSGADAHRVPRIGDDVYIGVGATIIGDVDVGRGAKIGAGAVVVHDVPEGATAVGNPARIRLKGSADATAR